MATAKKTPKKNPRKRPRKLSNIPSKLLAQAIDDLEFVERSSKFQVEMSDYVRPPEYTHSGKCEVCLGGAALVCAMGVKNLFDYPDDARLKAYALDWFRRGDIADALEELGAKSNVCLDFDAVSYDVNPTLFKAQMRGIVLQLKAVGL